MTSDLPLLPAVRQGYGSVVSYVAGAATITMNQASTVQARHVLPYTYMRG